MGIQLPPELVEVAAKAGVTWPEADEDAMRTSAAAWRDAGDRITGLAGDSDGSATRALTGITGGTGDAARTHWNRVVAPDGDLNTAAKGCHAAADRLEHGADQIGATKVELVRELVNLAKNTDAANSAAAAGHPTALLGLDTAVAGASANVANLANTLAASVRLDSGVDVGATTPPVNANPGSHGPGGGLLDTVGGVVDKTVGAVAAPVTGALPAVVAPVTGALPEVTGAVTGALPEVAGAVTGAVPVVTGAVPAVTDALPAAAPVADSVRGVVPAVVPEVVPGVTAPVAHVAPAVAPIVMAPEPAQAAPHVAVDFGPAQPAPAQASFEAPPLVNTTDGTVTQSAATLLDRPLLPVEAPAQPQAPAQQPQTPPVQAPTQAPGFGPASPATPTPPAASGTPGAGGVVGAVQRTDQPVSQRLADSATGQRTTDQSGQRTTDQSGQQRTADQTAAQKHGEPKPGEPKHAAASQSQQPQTSAPAPAGKDGKRPDDAAALDVVGFFYFRAFPRGTNPQPSTRPIRQVEPSAAEVSHVTGLRFPSQDHPHADLVGTEPSQPRQPHQALSQDHPIVRNLADGYDPQAGLHEREWDARFVRRADPLEHAWPPAGVFPEGGYEASRPDVLPAGTELDRFGTPEGRVLSTAGTRFAARSLPPTDLAAGYRRYVVSQPLPVWRTISVGWFGQPGGGTRYRTTYPVADLVALGYLTEMS